MAPRKDTEQSDDWRNQAGQSSQSGTGGNKQGQRDNLTGGNQQSGRGQGGSKQSGNPGQRQGARDEDELMDEESGQRGQRGQRGDRDQQR